MKRIKLFLQKLNPFLKSEKEDVDWYVDHTGLLRFKRRVNKVKLSDEIENMEWTTDPQTGNYIHNITFKIN